MVEVQRDNLKLTVSHGPGRAYRRATYGSVLGALLALAWVLGQPDAQAAAADPWALLALLAALLVFGVLARAWRTTTTRFDRQARTVTFERAGLARRVQRDALALARVATLLDRRSPRGRSLALVLDDHSALEIAHVGEAAASELETLAVDLANYLQLPIELGRGALLAARFEIEALIGRGGMGLVYRARDRTSGQPVALKLARADRGEEERLARFSRESLLLAELDHPRIARHVAHGTTEAGEAYLAMQWLEGEDLAAALKRGRMSLADSLTIVAQAADALAAVHARGIVHRDLKPSNLFLVGGSRSNVMLLDFGVARGGGHESLLTAPSALIGTPYYMAPEQASATRRVSPAADVFALGCVFYECLTGRRPFDAEQLLGVLARILYDNPEPVASLRPEVPRALEQLLQRMLDKQPSQRPSDAAALLRELELLPAMPSEAGELARAASVLPATSSTDQVLVCVILAVPAEGHWPEALDGDRLESIRGAMQRFGCPFERLLGGSLLATVLPRASATDQVRIAAHCALHLREQLPGSRIAIATGRAPLGPSAVVGEAVDRAQQLLEQMERAGSIDAIGLDALTRRLVEDRFAVMARDSHAILIGENASLDESRPLLGKPTPCVGRELELIQLEGSVASALDEAEPKLALVLGPAGAGKSRLRHELVRRLRERRPEAALLVGYGDPLSAGSPYVLLGDALRRYAGVGVGSEPAAARAALESALRPNLPVEQQRRISEFLGELAGVPFPADDSPPLAAARGDHLVMNEQIALAFQDWLAAETAARPVVLILEDMQWGDALTLKLLEGALRHVQRGALFLLVIGRPETEEIFPKLFGERRDLLLSLRPLAPKASERLVRNVLGTRVSDDSLARIVRLSAGNALFLEELIRAAAEGTAGDVPETVVAMLQARLSRLSPEARRVLRAASVIGETFWLGGVRAICREWGATEEPAGWLTQLVDSELLAELRDTRYPGERAFAFRHALVCDAARGLVTETDLESGHRAAWRFLEAVGEGDAIVLARHAAGGGDRERAIQFYLRAAEQSLELCDFEEALARATAGIEAGADGHALGALESVLCAAHCNQGNWPDAAERGLSALEHLPKTGVHWAATVEKLMQVLPNVGALERQQQLSDELLEIVPEPEARPAYLRALCSQLIGHAVQGAHDRGRRCIALMDRLVPLETERDLAARAYALLWKAVFISICERDAASALAYTEQAVRDLTASGISYRLSLAHIVQSFSALQLGDVEHSVRAARIGRAIAQEQHDDYHVALADWYLGYALAERAEPAQLEEAEQCARTMRELNAERMFEGTARNLSARIAVAKRDWPRAEAEAREARTLMIGLEPYRLVASASLIESLLQLGSVAEAAQIARDDLASLRAAQGPMFSEVHFLLRAAEALRASGDAAASEASLRDALERIESRAAAIPDEARRAVFYAERAENRRARELERSWLASSV